MPIAEAQTKTSGPSSLSAAACGQPARRLDAGVADRGLVLLGESSRDRGAGQMDHGVDPRQADRARVRRDRHCRSSFARAGRRTSRMTRCPPVVRNAVSADPTRPGRAGDGDDHRLGARLGGIAMRGEVVGQLAMPVDERRPQGRAGNRGVDLVAHPRAAAGSVEEFVGVPPPADGPRRQRSRPRRRQHVDEPVRRVEPVAIVLGDPAQPAGQPEHRLAVGERLGLGHHRHRLPRRDESRHRARPGVPGEHLGQRVVDDALVLDAHGSLRC